MLPYFTQESWFSRLCPWGALEASIPWALWNPTDQNFLALTPENAPIRDLIGWPYYLKIGILVSFLTMMIFIVRPFCRFACPLGAIFSLFNKFSVLRLTVNHDTCTQCDICYRLCPVDIKVYEDTNSPECIRCLECTQCRSVKLSLIGGQEGKGARG